MYDSETPQDAPTLAEGERIHHEGGWRPRLTSEAPTPPSVDFRYVTHDKVDEFAEKGWRRHSALDDTHHGQYAALMEAPVSTSGANILREAAKLMEGDRAEAYGEASVMFAKIRDLWNAYLGYELTSQDVAMMLSLMKAARVKVGAPRPDNFVDGAAYVAFAGSL